MVSCAIKQHQFILGRKITKGWYLHVFLRNLQRMWLTYFCERLMLSCTMCISLLPNEALLYKSDSRPKILVNKPRPNRSIMRGYVYFSSVVRMNVILLVSLPGLLVDVQNNRIHQFDIRPISVGHVILFIIPNDFKKRYKSSIYT